MKTYGRVDVEIYVFLTSALAAGVVSFTFRSLYPRGQNAEYPLDRRLGGPQGRSERQGEVRMLDLTRARNPTPQSSSPQPVTIPTALAASELYRQSDRSLLAKLDPTFANRGCRVVSATYPHGRILGFLDRSRYFFFQVAPQLYSRG
jgi:hypothetical protein